MPFQTGSVAIHNDDQHTGSAKRSAANGVAGLDAGALVPNAQNPAVNTTHIAAVAPHSGHEIKAHIVSFTGNGTQNRAVAHGFGAKPSWFRVVPYNPDGLVSTQWVLGMGAVQHFFTASLGAITECDATNIYVGNAAVFHGNVNAGSYIIIMG